MENMGRDRALSEEIMGLNLDLGWFLYFYLPSFSVV